MEGIRDGFVGDDCFVCGLLWPGARPCPRCRGRASWCEARMMDDALVAVRVARAWDAWEAEGDREALAALLTVVHLDGEAALEALDGVGTDLERLRRAWTRLASDEVPSGE
jgi:methylphosphotriester-DNA--protein-cysteine methyltransferase